MCLVGFNELQPKSRGTSYLTMQKYWYEGSKLEKIMCEILGRAIFKSDKKMRILNKRFFLLLKKINFVINFDDSSPKD